MRSTKRLNSFALLAGFALLCATGALKAQTVANGVTGATVSATPGNSPSGARPLGTGAALMGIVAKSDGSPLPSGVAVQRVCSTVAQTVARTDADGHFSFQLGSSSLLPLDASESGARNSAGVLGTLPWSPASSGGGSSGPGVGGTNSLSAVMNCEIRASLAGYRSDSVSIGSRHSSDNPYLGVIVLHPLDPGDRRASAVSANALAAPKAAADAYEKGIKALRAGDTAAARKSLLRAVKIYPRYAEAWFELGFAASREHDWREAARCMDRGIEFDSTGKPQTWYADAIAHYYLDDFDIAERSAREAIRLDSARTNPRAGYVLGMILARKNDYRGAAEELRVYLRLAPHAPDIGQVKAQLAEIETRQ